MTGNSCDYVDSIYLLSAEKESDLILDSKATQMKKSYHFEEIPVVLLNSLSLKVTDTTVEN